VILDSICVYKAVLPSNKALLGFWILIIYIFLFDIYFQDVQSDTPQQHSAMLGPNNKLILCNNSTGKIY